MSLETYERRSTTVSGGSTLFSDERPRVMIGELYNENDTQNTLTDQRQPTTLNAQSVTPLDDFSFLQGRVDPTARVEAQGPFDIGTHLDGLYTTNERPTTTHDTRILLSGSNVRQISHLSLQTVRISWLDLLSQ